MRARRPLEWRRGFALPAALVALVLLSALVAGALFIATEELRAGRTDVADQRALAVAEWALERAVLAWDAPRSVALAVGSHAVIADTSPAPGEHVTVTATRAQRAAFWLTSHASSAADGRGVPARHTVAASMRLVGPSFLLQAALVAAGQVTVSDGGRVDGGGVAPGDTALCADAWASGAGLVVPDSLLACGATCDGGVPPGVTGDPPVRVQASGASGAAGSSFGDDTRESLARRATIVLDEGTFAPRPSGGSGWCDRSDPLNWGDPDAGGVCRDFLPIIAVRGSAVMAAGAVGQGVLLVDGDLRLEAGARFAGVVIAADDIVVSGPGAEITGVALAADRDAADGSRVTGGGAVRLAGCAVRRASLAASRLVRTPERWWAELR